MTKFHFGILFPVLVSMVYAQVEFSVPITRICSGRNSSFTCIESQSADSVAFYRDNASTTALCIVDLNKPCSSTFPLGLPCGCVKSEGTKKTSLYITDITTASSGPWLCGILRLRDTTIPSNIVAISVDDRAIVVPIATALVVVLALVSVVAIIVIVILGIVNSVKKTIKIVVAAVLLLILLIFLLAVGIYNIGEHNDCVRDTSGLYEASLAFIIIGTLVGGGCIAAIVFFAVRPE